MILRAKMPATSRNKLLGRALRQARGDLSLRTLGERVGRSAAQLSRIETGAVETPPEETLIRAAKGLGRRPEPLLVLAGQLDGPVARQALVDLVDRSANPGAFATERTRLARQLEAHDALERKLATAEREVATASARVQAAHDELKIAERKTAHFRSDEAAARKRLTAGEGLDQRDRGRLEREIKQSTAAAAEAHELREFAASRLSKLSAETKRLEAAAAKLRAQLEQVDELDRAELELACRLFVAEPAEDAFGFGEWGTGKTHRLFLSYLAERMGEEATVEVDPASLTADLLLHDPAVGTDIIVEAKRWPAARKDVQDQLLHYWAAFAGHDDALQTVRQLWAGLTNERRQRVLDFVRDQHRLSVQERLEGGGAAEEK